MDARRRRSSAAAAAASQRAPPPERASPPRAARHGCAETPPGTRSEGAAPLRPPRARMRLRRGRRRQRPGGPGGPRGARAAGAALRPGGDREGTGHRAWRRAGVRFTTARCGVSRRFSRFTFSFFFFFFLFFPSQARLRLLPLPQIEPQFSKRFTRQSSLSDLTWKRLLRAARATAPGNPLATSRVLLRKTCSPQLGHSTEYRAG
ncbi:uncharacterized protein [Taeniopygia guttata]|uniref:uncharacterized protein n=1 Tax=Taeniopygia guttata TaxID=59729 RepID=UPI003BB938FE